MRIALYPRWLILYGYFDLWINFSMDNTNVSFIRDKIVPFPKKWLSKYSIKHNSFVRTKLLRNAILTNNNKAAKPSVTTTTKTSPYTFISAFPDSPYFDFILQKRREKWANFPRGKLYSFALWGFQGKLSVQLSIVLHLEKLNAVQVLCAFFLHISHWTILLVKRIRVLSLVHWTKNSERNLISSCNPEQDRCSEYTLYKKKLINRINIANITTNYPELTYSISLYTSRKT